MRGVICFIPKGKNYGFIRSEDNKKVFFHFSEIKFKGEIKPGIKVEFAYGKNKKGETAVNVVRQKRKKPKRWDNLISFIENANIDEESKKIFLKNIAQFRQQELHILIAGPTGVGKSSTINALFDTEIAEVGYGVDPQTKHIKEWKLDENLFLHDTPGLGDGADKDSLYKQMIKEELGKKNSDGSAVIDVALVIVDGSRKDIGTSINLINDTIIPNMEDKSRVLVAINRCDMADDGRGWKKEGNRPDKKLVRRLNETAESIHHRIKESTGVDIQPIYYSALYKYNISKLLSFIIKCTPVKKRFFYMDNLNNDERNWRNDDIRSEYFAPFYNRNVYDRYEDLSDHVSDLNQSVKNMEKKYQQSTSDLRELVTGMKKTYQQEVETMFSEALDEVSKEISKGSKTSISFSFKKMGQQISDGISAGAEIGGKIGEVVPVIGKGVGKAVGGVIGAIGGFVKSLFS